MVLIILISILIMVGILYLFNSAYDDSTKGVKYRCHKCRKKFYRKDLILKGSWHTKEWYCPNCNYHNVTIESYDY